jgi:hypothetical protein
MLGELPVFRFFNAGFAPRVVAYHWLHVAGHLQDITEQIGEAYMQRIRYRCFTDQANQLKVGRIGYWRIL